MWEFLYQPFLYLLAPFVVYFVARVLFLAYFHAKRDHLRRLMNGLDQSPDSRDAKRRSPDA